MKKILAILCIAYAQASLGVIIFNGTGDQVVVTISDAREKRQVVLPKFKEADIDMNPTSATVQLFSDGSYQAWRPTAGATEINVALDRSGLPTLEVFRPPVRARL